MKRNIIYILLIAALMLSLVFALASCGSTPTVPSDLDLSGISLDGKTVDYNGEVHSLAVKGTLPEGVTVAYTNNDKEDSGKYEVVARFYYKGIYIKDADLRASLEIKKVSLAGYMYGVSFNNSTVIYDGEKHSIAIVGDVPAAVRVTYVGNGVSSVGEHTVTAKFNVDEKNYYSIPDMTATIKILNATVTPEIPADLDLSGITLDDKTVTYNGEVHSLAIEGTLPAGVEVKYSNNDKTNAGIHSVVASFYYKGVYLEDCDLIAELVINKADIDTSGLSFEGASFYYNGSAHSIIVTGTLPEGIVRIEYEGNSQSDVGNYTVKANFVTDPNYNEISAWTVNMSIVEANMTPEIPADLDLSGITLDGYVGNYDKEMHYLAYEGTLPEGVTAEYLNNGQKNAGTHTVTLKFYYMGMYIEGADKSANIVINPVAVDMTGVVFNSSNVLYDGKEHSIAVGGTLPEGVLGVVYEGNGKTNVGSYTVTAKFVTDENHIAPSDMTATLTVSIILLEQLEGLVFNDGTFTYDGNEKSIYIKDEVLEKLPEGVTLLGYEGNGQTDVGEYTVTAKFAVNGVYQPLLDFSATLKIKKGAIFVHAYDKEVTFDGEYHKIDLIWETTDGVKPLGVVVVEENNNQRSIGTYTVRFKFVLTDAANVEGLEDIVVTLTIKQNNDLVGNDGIMYEITGESTVSVVDYNGSNTGVDIPATFAVKGTTYNVTEIANYAFAGKAITSVKIPASVLGVGVGAFKDCDKLTTVTLNEGLVRISERAFENSGITELVVPDSVIAIGQAALRGCNKIASITLRFIGGSDNSSNEYLGYIFGASGYVGNGQFVPKSLKTLVLSDACTHIPAYSLRDCDSLTEIVISSGVSEILNNAFRGCTSLKSIYIPATVKAIPAAAHNYDSPFYGIEGLKIYLEADSVPATSADSRSGFGAAWNVLDDNGTRAEVITGTSYDEYLAK